MFVESILILFFLFMIYWILYLRFKTDRYEGYLNTFNGRMSIDDQYFYDKLLDDVFYYPNMPDGTTGWVNCKIKCPGNCVEFGVTGASYCFPY